MRECARRAARRGFVVGARVGARRWSEPLERRAIGAIRWSDERLELATGACVGGASTLGLAVLGDGGGSGSVHEVGREHGSNEREGPHDSRVSNGGARHVVLHWSWAAAFHRPCASAYGGEHELCVVCLFVRLVLWWCSRGRACAMPRGCAWHARRPALQLEFGESRLCVLCVFCSCSSF